MNNKNEQLTKNYKVVIHNNDTSTFEQVIASLMLYCNHNRIQAEQCANIIHTVGQYSVKENISQQDAIQYAHIFNDIGLTTEVLTV